MPASLPNQNLPQNPQYQGVLSQYQFRKPKKKKVTLNKLMISSYFRIGLTFFLMLILFLTASFIAFQSEQKRKKLKDYEKQIPKAEIIVPESDSNFPNSTPIPENNETGSGATVEEGCVVGGCNNELCQDADAEPLVSICLYKPEYACYDSAACERQANGRCGWTQTEELTSCIAEYQ